MGEIKFSENIRTEKNSNPEMGIWTRVVYDCPMCSVKQTKSVEGTNPLVILDAEEEVEARAAEHHKRRHSGEAE